MQKCLTPCPSRRRLFAFYFFCLSLLSAPIFAEGRLEDTTAAADLEMALLRLQTTASALHITAHPDDEDGPTLTVLARKHGARTLLFTMNRGEGGANLVSSEGQDALGVLRTLELLEACRYYGVKPFFNRLVDYGFSKRVQEALDSWGGSDEILRDLVAVIRRERPDVLIARFRDDPRDGGGHATAHLVGLMSRLAFEAAGDPARFPEQLQQGLLPWQPAKLYIHSARSDQAPTSEESTVTVEAGEYNPLLGASYFQFSRLGMAHHRTQGMTARTRPAGPFRIDYERVASRQGVPQQVHEEFFFDGLDTSLTGIVKLYAPTPPEGLDDSLGRIQSNAQAALEAVNPAEPQACLPPLLEGYKQLRELRLQFADNATGLNEQASFLLAKKEGEFEAALRKTLAPAVEWRVTPELQGRTVADPFRVTTTFNHAVPGQEFGISLRIVNRSPFPLTPASAEVEVPPGWEVSLSALPADPLAPQQTLEVMGRVRVAVDAEPTRPYWFRNSVREHLYEARDPSYQTLPLPPPPLRGKVRLEIHGVPFAVSQPITVVRYDPFDGITYPPVNVVPPVSVRFATSTAVLPLDRNDFPLSVTVHNSVAGKAAGELRLVLPEGWKAVPVSASFAFTREDEEKTFDFNIDVSAAAPTAGAERIQAEAWYEGRPYREGYTTLTAWDQTRFNYFEPARLEVRRIPLEIPADLRIGYVVGKGDNVPETLQAIGIQRELLEGDALATENLDSLDAIVVGPRAYAVRSDLLRHNGRLLEYVSRGGVMIVLYQTPEFDHNYGPYPYSLGANPEEVSEETAPVEFLQPQHPLFHFPNRITPQDFEGWLVERGSKFWRSWDPRYLPLLESHDSGQEPQKGGLLVARYGKGTYVYTAYAWHRQLPEGVAGAFRFFINLLSLNRTPPDPSGPSESRTGN